MAAQRSMSRPSGLSDALAAGRDAAMQMVDTSLVRVHQHGACISDNNHQAVGRLRGGLTSKSRAVVDTNGLPVDLALTPGEAHDNRLCSVLLSALLPQTKSLADRRHDADWIRELARQQGAWANIPPKRNRKDPICFSPYLYRARIRIWLRANESTPFLLHPSLRKPKLETQTAASR